jgi:hypothetical protein
MRPATRTGHTTVTAKATTDSLSTATRTLIEYRITWRRPHWTANSANKSRHMQRATDVDRFIAGLRARGPLSLLHVDQRYVGAWQPIRGFDQ